MLNKLRQIYNDKVMENYNPNDMAPELSTSFVKKLLKPVEYNPFEEDDEISPEDFFFAFRHAVKHGEDEIEIHYPSGESITLDIVVAKHLLMNASAEQIVQGAYSADYMHNLISQVCDEVVDLDDACEDETED